jgi:hypothetical protein
MTTMFNRLADVQKISGGSGEMFWRGAFPGYSFEVNPDQDTELDTASVRAEFENFGNGLQRYMALTGVTAKSLSPQVADPSAHITSLLELISISLGVPKRKLFGSEQAQLASTQDDFTWNKRVKKRQEGYVSPFLITPLLDRLISLGILPRPTDIKIDWPDLNTRSDLEKADILVKLTDAFGKYIQNNVSELIPPAEFFSIFTDLSQEQIDLINTAWEEKALLESHNHDDETDDNEPIETVDDVADSESGAVTE